MISRPAIIGVVGAIVVLAAVLLNYFISEDAPTETATDTSPSGTTGGEGSAKPADRKTESAAPASSAKSQPEAEPEDKTTAKPVFDVVRVDPDGNTVIAGRSTPNSKVRIRDGGKTIGEVTSDGRGDWVFVPEKRLEPGSRMLTLSIVKDGQKVSESEDAVVLVIPEPGKNIAGANAAGENGEDRTPLAMVVPRDQASTAPTRVIQAPKAADSSTTAETKNDTPTVRSFPEPEAKSDDEAKASASGDPGVPVALDTVDYDDKGDVVFSGRGKAGDQVQVYVDNKLVGSANTGADGRWTLKPTERVEPGEHDIRVDKVTEAGKVLARIELPFVRAKPFSGLPDQTLVIIQPGNNLWRIASRVYGNGLRYTDIFQANADQIRNPDLIYPGQVFGLPKTN
jgi:nucleoid-associated protein YgaU